VVLVDCGAIIVLRKTASRCAAIEAIGPSANSASSGSAKRGSVVYSPSFWNVSFCIKPA